LATRREIRLQLARATERRDRKEREERGDDHGRGDEPTRDVAGPGPKSGVQPGKREYGKDGSCQLMKKLLERAPEAGEAASLRLSCARCRRHESSLTQNARQTLLPLKRYERTGREYCGQIGDNRAWLTCIQ